MLNLFLIFFGKMFINLSRLLNLGNGSTWPGHIALKLNQNFIRQMLASHPKGAKLKIVIIAGTNGKTTTGRLITSVIREDGKSYLQNKAGANLLNGLASTLIKGASLPRPGLGRLNVNYLIFECDEYALPEVIDQTNPNYIICLNLFRDQLDRYGEIDSITKRWSDSFKNLTSKTTLILNSDDPQVSYLGKNTKALVKYFGLSEIGEKNTKHGADSIYCPKCSANLEFEKVFFSHLGIWKCPKCKLKRPTPDHDKSNTYPLPGTYNKYNTIAASLVLSLEELKEEVIRDAFNRFSPAFGRGEKIIYKGKHIQIFLSKNPTSFNESLSTVKELGGKNLVILLNDKIPDGLDVSWIWDINFEEILEKDMNIGISGDRTYDMAVRLKYAGFFAHHNENAETIIDKMLDSLEADETLYFLPNYSAMLDIRKLLTGRKIL